VIGSIASLVGPARGRPIPAWLRLGVAACLVCGLVLVDVEGVSGGPG
jgi:energy-converting hydrogenase Eha subunit E